MYLKHFDIILVLRRAHRAYHGAFEPPKLTLPSLPRDESAVTLLSDSLDPTLRTELSQTRKRPHGEDVPEEVRVPKLHWS